MLDKEFDSYLEKINLVLGGFIKNSTQQEINLLNSQLKSNGISIVALDLLDQDFDEAKCIRDISEKEEKIVYIIDYLKNIYTLINKNMNDQEVNQKELKEQILDYLNEIINY